MELNLRILMSVAINKSNKKKGFFNDEPKDNKQYECWGKKFKKIKKKKK